MGFRLKKGRLSEYWEKNGWKNEVMPLMGFERGPEGRNLSNRDHRTKINSLKPRQTYENKLMKPKVERIYFERRPELMGEKMTIRKKRN